MTPEELNKKILELEKRVKGLETIDRNRGLVDFVDVKAVTDGNITISTGIGAGGGTVNHMDFPDKWEVIRVKDKAYLRPLYIYTRI